MYDLSSAGCVTHTIQCRLMAMGGSIFSKIRNTGSGSGVVSYEEQWEETGII